jgi:hypothetical protein
MAKTKLSVSLDPDTIQRAKALVQVASVSDLLDIALGRLIQTEEERQHVAGYLKNPVDQEFATLAEAGRDAIADDVDWAELYGVKR